MRGDNKDKIALNPSEMEDGRLKSIIKDKIRANGPMTMADYMALCLGHPQYGYYMTRDPLGAAGDFTTAPEISQMFGEMIGMWLADLWMKMGSPSEFVLLECGPGRGTLMADILRTTAGLSGFHAAKKLYLMEMSPVLKSIQKRNLDKYDATWIDDLSALPSSIPVFIIANEFLDALPVHQLSKRNGLWHERFVDVQDDAFHIVEKPVDEMLIKHIPPKIFHEQKDGVFEISSILNQYVNSVNNLLIKQGGLALFVDYGHTETAMGDTLQAMKSHRFVDIFDTAGSCDLTAHVDFENIAMLSWANDIIVHGPTTQGAFLKQLGIEVRAERLMSGANDHQRNNIMSALERLIDTKHMGSLFKVMALCSDPNLKIEGFDENL